MPINQAGRQKRTVQVYNFLPLIIPQADHSAILHRNVGLVNLPAKYVHQPPILKQQFSRPLAASVTKLVGQVANSSCDCPWAAIASSTASARPDNPSRKGSSV